MRTQCCACWIYADAHAVRPDACVYCGAWTCAPCLQHGFSTTPDRITAFCARCRAEHAFVPPGLVEAQTRFLRMASWQRVWPRIRRTAVSDVAMARRLIFAYSMWCTEQRFRRQLRRDKSKWSAEYASTHPDPAEDNGTDGADGESAPRRAVFLHLSACAARRLDARRVLALLGEMDNAGAGREAAALVTEAEDACTRVCGAACPGAGPDPAYDPDSPWVLVPCPVPECPGCVELRPDTAVAACVVCFQETCGACGHPHVQGATPCLPRVCPVDGDPGACAVCALPTTDGVCWFCGPRMQRAQEMPWMAEMEGWDVVRRALAVVRERSDAEAVAWVSPAGGVGAVAQCLGGVPWEDPYPLPHVARVIGVCRLMARTAELERCVYTAAATHGVDGACVVLEACRRVVRQARDALKYL